MIYIVKDIHETLDYVFIRAIDDDITSVSYSQDGQGGLVILSCSVNSSIVKDSSGISYPAGRAIILWCAGGNALTHEKVRITYNTAGGRVLDEDITFRLVESA